MPIPHSIVLGIVQGLTEFLPVSSSAHLELLPWLFGWEQFDGDAAREQAFDVALHIGTLVGAVFYLRADIARYVKAVIAEVGGRLRPASDGASTQALPHQLEQRRDARVGFALLLSVIPAAIVGVVLESALLTLGEEVLVIAIALVVGGWLLWWADRHSANQSNKHGSPERQIDSFGIRESVWLGIAQACALVPGVSRAGATMTIGRLLRFDRSAAARISFLMSLPVIAGAGVFRGLGLIGESVPSADWTAMAVGLVAAALTSWLALWLVIRLLARAGGSIGHRLFSATATYRTALAVLAAVVLFAGWR